MLELTLCFLFSQTPFTKPNNKQKQTFSGELKVPTRTKRELQNAQNCRAKDLYKETKQNVEKENTFGRGC